METRNNHPPVIADTSALVSIAVASDENHDRALAGAQQLWKQAAALLIPAEVLAETINLLGKKFGRAHAIATGRKSIGDDAFLVVDTDPEIRSQALNLLEQAPSGTSFIDCLVVAAAEHYNTRTIFGFDEYFSRQKYWFPRDDQEQAA